MNTSKETKHKFTTLDSKEIKTAVIIQTLGLTLGPLVIPYAYYHYKKSDSDFVRHHCIEALNFYTTTALLTLACLLVVAFMIYATGLSFIILIPILIFTFIYLAAQVFGIEAIKYTGEGKFYEFKFAARFFS